LEEDILRVVEETRISIKIVGVVNAFFIALIPLKNDLPSFEHYRPISPCNLIYKNILNIIAN